MSSDKKNSGQKDSGQKISGQRNPGKTRTIEVNYLARVEGEGGLKIKVKGGHVQEVQLNIFEPPRFFEALLQGRRYDEAPDITSRICGICPVAYQMSTISAMENALGVTVDLPIRQLRRMLYCGEWVESHTLHVYMLHAPDFLGYESAIHMAKQFPEIVKRGLQLKKVGNELMQFLGGREIHPINVRVGGFYRAPLKREFKEIVQRLLWARDAALETVKWVSDFSFPDWERDYEFVCLRATDPVYPIEEGTFISNKGLAIDVNDYENWFTEEHVAHSTALQSSLKGRGAYLVGPLARFNLNFDRLSPLVQETAKSIGFVPPIRNPFKSIIARSLEILYACDETLRLIEEYQSPSVPSIATVPRASIGFGATEAPRGVLYHRYRLDDNGLIQEAKIVPPTSQNQKSVEMDLWQFVESRMSLPKKELSWQCEQAVRNYDPCISCAAHFMEVRWEEIE